MKRTLRVVSDVFENVSVAFLAILCLSVFSQIILRNVFSIGSVVLEELARVSLVALVFLMIPVLTLRKQQIVVDFVLNKLPAPIRKGFDLAIQLICAACSVYLLIAICNIMKMNYNVRTAALKMPNYIFYLPMTFGLAFDVIGTLDHFIDTIKGKGAAK